MKQELMSPERLATSLSIPDGNVQAHLALFIILMKCVSLWQKQSKKSGGGGSKDRKSVV